MAKSKIIISKLSTKAPKNVNKKEIEKKTKELTSQIRDLVTLMYANKNHNHMLFLPRCNSS